MVEKTPQNDPLGTEWQDDEQFSVSLGNLLRSAAPPPMPSAEHLRMLNRRVLLRTERRGWRRMVEAITDTGRALWYQPWALRGVAFAGATAALVVGVVIGSSQNEMATPTNSLPTVITTADPTLAFENIQPVSTHPSPSGSLFPSVYVVANQPAATNGQSNSQWVSLTDKAEPDSLITDELLSRFNDSVLRDGSTVVPRLREDPALSQLATRIVNDDMIGRVQRLKLNLYLTGQSETISDVSRIEEMLHQILASQTARALSRQDLDSQALFAEAERHLIGHDYRRAEEAFNELAHSDAPAELVALSWYHLGNIYFEFHGDFAGARQCYQRVIDANAGPIFPEDIVNDIDERLTLLNDAASQQYEPIQILRKMDAAPAGEVLTLFEGLMRDYPASEAVAAGINSLAERAMRDTPDQPNLPHRVIALLREYQTMEGARFRTLAQIRLADVVYFGLQDYPQALIEYGKIEIAESESDMQAMVQDRIAQILDQRVR